MKLSFWTIIIMAISVAFGILAFAILHQTLPTLQATKNYNDYRAALETEANKKPLTQRRVQKAMRDVQAATDKWNGYVATRTPEADVNRGGISLAVNPYQLTVDTLKFRNSVQRAVNAQVKKGGVKVVGSGPYVRSVSSTDASGSEILADYYNYPGIKFPVVIFDLGQVTVQGTYAQIMANVRSYKSMPHYLAVADGLAITGTSPNLTGTYSLSIVGFIRGKDIFASPTTAGAAPAGGTASPFGPSFGGPGGSSGAPRGFAPPSGPPQGAVR